MAPKKLFIFDVDGTLVDSYTAISRSLNFARRRLGYAAVNLQRVKRSIGRGNRMFVATFFPEDKVDAALRIYRVHHRKALIRYAKLYPRTRAVLSGLRRRGKILAVASNRPADFTDMLLKGLKIKKYFHAVYCGDTIKSLKPKPKILQIILRRFKLRPSEAVYIGDMDIDMQTAQAARIDALFKKGGSSTLSEAKKYNIAGIITHLDELLSIG